MQRSRPTALALSTAALAIGALAPPAGAAATTSVLAPTPPVPLPSSTAPAAVSPPAAVRNRAPQPAGNPSASSGPATLPKTGLELPLQALAALLLGALGGSLRFARRGRAR